MKKPANKRPILIIASFLLGLLLLCTKTALAAPESDCGGGCADYNGCHGTCVGSQLQWVTRTYDCPQWQCSSDPDSMYCWQTCDFCATCVSSGYEETGSPRCYYECLGCTSSCPERNGCIGIIIEGEKP
jgi:hypothetical protein